MEWNGQFGRHYFRPPKRRINGGKSHHDGCSQHDEPIKESNPSFDGAAKGPKGMCVRHVLHPILTPIVSRQVKGSLQQGIDRGLFQTFLGAFRSEIRSHFRRYSGGVFRSGFCTGAPRNGRFVVVSILEIFIVDLDRMVGFVVVVSRRMILLGSYHDS
jgi:hypothetical protein